MRNKRMKKLGVILLGLLFLGNTPLYGGAPWKTDYKEAVAESKQTQKPIILFFTGSDWCTWCKKLEREALDTPEFLNKAGSAYIFVLLDYPRKTTLSKVLTEQNKRLKEKFKISSYPTLILIDGDEKVIGKTGYRKGGGGSYANHLKEMVEQYERFQNKMDKVASKPHTTKELKDLYLKAQELQQKDEMGEILEQALSQGRDSFFLTEKYRQFAREGRLGSSEAIALREEILEDDGRVAQLNASNVAVIDFQQRLDAMDEKGYDAKFVVTPLVDYLKKYGDQDVANRWRLEVSIAQVFIKVSDYKPALQHLHSALKLAPEDMKSDLKKAIDNVKSMAKNNGNTLEY